MTLCQNMPVVARLSIFAQPVSCLVPTLLAVIRGKRAFDAPQLALPPIVRAVRFLDDPDAVAFFEDQIPVALAVEIV